MIHFFEALMGCTLSNFAFSFDTTGVTMALPSWMFEFVQGNEWGYDGAYELESVGPIKAVAHCTYYIQQIN